MAQFLDQYVSGDVVPAYYSEHFDQSEAEQELVYTNYLALPPSASPEYYAQACGSQDDPYANSSVMPALDAEYYGHYGVDGSQYSAQQSGPSAYADVESLQTDQISSVDYVLADGSSNVATIVDGGHGVALQATISGSPEAEIHDHFPVVPPHWVDNSTVNGFLTDSQVASGSLPASSYIQPSITGAEFCGPPNGCGISPVGASLSEDLDPEAPNGIPEPVAYNRQREFVALLSGPPCSFDPSANGDADELEALISTPVYHDDFVLTLWYYEMCKHSPEAAAMAQEYCMQVYRAKMSYGQEHEEENSGMEPQASTYAEVQQESREPEGLQQVRPHVISSVPIEAPKSAQPVYDARPSQDQVQTGSSSSRLAFCNEPSQCWPQEGESSLAQIVQSAPLQDASNATAVHPSKRRRDEENNSPRIIAIEPGPEEARPLKRARVGDREQASTASEINTDPSLAPLSPAPVLEDTPVAGPSTSSNVPPAPQRIFDAKRWMRLILHQHAPYPCRIAPELQNIQGCQGHIDGTLADTRAHVLYCRARGPSDMYECGWISSSGHRCTQQIKRSHYGRHIFECHGPPGGEYRLECKACNWRHNGRAESGYRHAKTCKDVLDRFRRGLSPPP
ncbi:uncharacterized protein FIBRA_00423 [Fibroporia radiculosa]|uniref:Uncharacterized protein n=1 Tax=Fibroporia radiculosa TaxID=599839 RepID=J4I7X6_9APHY|nr:uncharacterized protein FIBRA_00423 [Fibroporia radiculosa]CCL98426.1 predicted protein [Fibroporia radiculosa]